MELDHKVSWEIRKRDVLERHLYCSSLGILYTYVHMYRYRYNKNEVLIQPIAFIKL